MSGTASPWSRRLSVLGGLVLVCGLIVGYAHWRVHRLQTADVAWSTPVDYKGTTAVAGGNAYIFNDFVGFQVVRLSDGKSRVSKHAGDDASQLYVGRSGWFAIRGVYGHPKITFYSPDGKERWARMPKTPGEFDMAPVAIGDGTIQFVECTKAKTCRLVSVDGSGKELWAYEGASGRAFTADNQESLDEEDIYHPDGHRVSRLPSVPVVGEHGRVTALDEQGRPHGESISATEATIVGDTLLEIAPGPGCRYRAVRDGVEVWRSSIPCSPKQRVWSVLAYPGRVYVTYEGDHRDMVAVDLTDGHAQQLGDSISPFNGKTLRATYAGPTAVVRQHKGRVTGIDPRTGKKLWERSFDKHSDDADPDADVYPGVTALDGRVSVITTYTGFWHWASFGRDKPLNLVTMLDPRTGKTTAHLLQKYLYTAVGLGPDKGTLVLADERLFRLDR